MNVARVVELSNGYYALTIGEDRIESSVYRNLLDEKAAEINAALENHPEIKRLREIESAANEALAGTGWPTSPYTRGDASICYAPTEAMRNLEKLLASPRRLGGA